MNKNFLSLMMVMVVSSLFGSFAAQANTVDLGAVMKDIADIYGRVGQQSTDTSKNAESATLCDQLLSDIATARTVMPDTVLQLPVDQQPAQFSKFQGMLDQLSTQVTQLKTDFSKNNNSAIANDLTAINLTKLAGHKAFR